MKAKGIDVALATRAGRLARWSAAFAALALMSAACGPGEPEQQADAEPALATRPAGVSPLFEPLPATAPEPADNPGTVERIALGHKLFLEPKLSRSGIIACNSCHVVGAAGVDGRTVAIGEGARTGPRNSPTVFNAAFLVAQFGDGRAPTLEEQAKGPIQAHVEMDLTPRRRSSVCARWVTRRCSRPRSPDEAEPLTFDNLARAIAAFERTLLTPGAPFDRYLAGDLQALSDLQKEGLALFEQKAASAVIRAPWSVARAEPNRPRGTGRAERIFGRAAGLPQQTRPRHARPRTRGAERMVDDVTDLSHPVLVHFYRAVVTHMDVWRQRMDATTNWAAATTAAMVTFTFGAVDSPHFVLLLAMAFDGVFLFMESRRYQLFDLWRRRFRLLNRYVIAPVLLGEGRTIAPEQREALQRVAEDLGRMVPHLPLRKAIGYRIRRNYGYLFVVGTIAWTLKLDVHPTPAGSAGEIVARAAVGNLSGVVVVAIVACAAVVLAAMALRAPSEQMLNWAEVPSPFSRFVTRTRAWGEDLLRASPEEED